MGLTYTPSPTGPGNLVPVGTALGPSKNLGTLCDASAVAEGQVTVRAFTGATTPSATAGVKWEFFHIYGTTTTSAAVAATATSVTVADASKLVVGQVIALYNGATKLGETVTISAIGGNVLTVSATTYSYNSGDPVYLIPQTADYALTPGPLSGTTYAAVTPYAKTVYLGQSKYFVRATNLDAVSTTVAVEATLDTLS